MVRSGDYYLFETDSEEEEEEEEKKEDELPKKSAFQVTLGFGLFFHQPLCAAGSSYTSVLVICKDISFG